VQQKAVQCELTAEQRRDIEARTGPLVEEQQGPYEDHLGANRSAVESCYQTGIGVWRTAAQTAITDFVRDNDHAPNYGPLIMALVALPMGYVGIGLNGAAAVGHLVASTAISALDAVPPSDRVAGFRTGMRSAYDRIYENRINSTSAIISNWQNGLNAGASSDLTQLKLGMMTNCFRRDFVTGTAVNAEGVRNVVYNAVKAAWDRIEAERRAARAERQGDIGDAYAEMDYCWVAREVVPSRWTEVRSYLLNVAPEHIRALYGEKGPQLAVALRADTGTRQSLRPLFEQVAEAGRTWQETGDTRAATLPESTFAPLVSLLHAS
jgi:hypothetical protein